LIGRVASLANAAADCASAGWAGGLLAIAEDNGGTTDAVDKVVGAEMAVVCRVAREAWNPCRR
jgi:hypothetical protein